MISLAIASPRVERVTGEEDAVTVKSHSLWKLSRENLFFLFDKSKFARQAPANQTWLQAKHGLTSPLIPLTEDVLESSQTADDAMEEEHINRQMTWQKVVEPPPNRTPLSYPPRPVIPSEVSYLSLLKGSQSYHLSPKVVFWGCVVVLIVLAGAFGVANTLGHRFSSSEASGALSLQVTPHEVAIGATISLRGANFSPQGQVGLTRDASIPILNTGGVPITQSDAQGKFTDTVQVQADWGSGVHTINAEDAITHKIASFPVLVTGKGTALRPSHLSLSINSLDLGSGDQATNGKQTISLTNLGSGQISWQGSATESWLMITPQSGTFHSGRQSKVVVAADRTNLQPGQYKARVRFTSDAGNIPLDVSMRVMPLDPHNKAVLQLTPPVLSFTGADGGAAPKTQAVTVKNPGVRPLNWTASSSVPWLSLSARAGTIQPANSAHVTVAADISRLLPGIYTGSITFSSPEPNAGTHSPQSIDVTVTITPHCTLKLSPGMLSFTAAYRQSSPPAKIVDLATSSSCSAPLKWNVTSNANWLTVSKSSGTAPDSLSIEVHANGLAPGEHNGALTFKSSQGTQTLLVYFMLGSPGPLACTLQAPSTPKMQFSTMAGSNPTAQTFRVSVTGTCAGSVTVTPTSAMASGSGWLSVSPTSGIIQAGQSANFTVRVSSASLKAGQYSGSISLSAVNSGVAVAGSPKKIGVTLDNRSSAILTANPSSLTFNGKTGTSTQAVTISNSGSGALNWTPALQSGAPAFVSLSASSGTSLAGGQSATVNVAVNATGVTSGQYTTSVQISATDAATGLALSTSPMTVPVTINVATPGMQLGATSLSFSTTEGTNPANQTTQLSNVGGGTLTWTVGTPSQSWLSVSPSSGSCVAGGSSTLTFSINVNGLVASANPYNATVMIIPSNGAPVTVTITLTVNALTPTPTAVSSTPPSTYTPS